MPGAQIALQMQLLSSNPEIDMVFGYAQNFVMANDDGTSYEKTINVLPGIGLQAALFRKKVFEITGLFSTTKGIHGFMDWYARALAAGLQLKVHNDVVFQRRIHGNNESISNKEETQKSLLTTLKVILERNRLKTTI